MRKLQSNNSDLYGVLTILALNNKTATMPDILHIIGSEGMLKLSKLFGGYMIRIPTLEEIREGLLIYEIAKDRINNKMTPSQIGKKYDLESSQVSKYLYQIHKIEKRLKLLFKGIISGKIN